MYIVRLDKSSTADYVFEYTSLESTSTGSRILFVGGGSVFYDHHSVPTWTPAPASWTILRTDPVTTDEILVAWFTDVKVAITTFRAMVAFAFGDDVLATQIACCSYNRQTVVSRVGNMLYRDGWR